METKDVLMSIYITKLLSYIFSSTLGNETSRHVTSTRHALNLLFNSNKSQKPSSSEISLDRELSDEQIRMQTSRNKYIKVQKNKNYTVKSGDNFSKIANKYGVVLARLLSVNGMNAKSPLSIGQVLKIPDTYIVHDVKTLGDIAKSLGISSDFVKRLKRVEDGNIGDNKFHNEPYKDKNGVETIGIGHMLRPGDKRKLTDQEVCELCAKDLLKIEENLHALLGGKQNYDRLPQGIKEAILDMGFNKGMEIITPDLVYCLKNGKYEAAINKMTHNKSIKTGQEMAGLSKRRLLDISLAMKIYPEGKIPQSNIKTAQQVYNRGVELLRQECKKSNSNFSNALASYNFDVKSYLGNKIKFITK